MERKEDVEWGKGTIGPKKERMRKRERERRLFSCRLIVGPVRSEMKKNGEMGVARLEGKEGVKINKRKTRKVKL